MNELRFRTDPPTLAALNDRLAVCINDRSLYALDLDVSEEVLPAFTFQSFFRVVQEKLPTFADISEAAIRLLQRQTVQLFPMTPANMETYKLFSLKLKTLVPSSGVKEYVCHLTVDEAIQQVSLSAKAPPATRLQIALDLEPKAKPGKEMAEKLQTILGYLLLEGRIMCICAIGCEVAARCEQLSRELGGPEYPEAVGSPEEFAYWLQLPQYLAAIRSAEPQIDDFLALYQVLDNRKPYHAHLRAVLEFQASCMQLNKRIQVAGNFLQTIFPHSLLHEIRGRWSGVQDVVSPFGRFFSQLFQQQHGKNQANRWDLKEFQSWRKVYDAFKKHEKCQQALYEHASAQLYALIRSRKKPREWMEYANDLGPQREHEESTFGRQYRFYDPHPVQTARAFVSSQKPESKREPVELAPARKKAPFKYTVQIAEELDGAPPFSPLADGFCDIGHTVVIEEWTLHIVPAEIARDQEIRRGTILYAVKGDVCFHRIFQVRSVLFLLKKFADRSFVLDDFPALAASDSPETGAPATECDHALAFNTETGIATISSGNTTLRLYSLKPSL
jgi:hypothetical protein